MRYQYLGSHPVMLHHDGRVFDVSPGDVIFLTSKPELPDWIELPPPVSGSLVGEPRNWGGGKLLTRLPWAQFTLGNPKVQWPDFVRVVPIIPQPDAPYGRYGASLIRTFREVPDAPGLVILEQDIAGDPLVVQEMEQAVVSNPDAIWAVPYRLYATSTGRHSPIWAHRGGLPSAWNGMESDYPCPEEPRAVGLGCTYLPKILIEHMASIEYTPDLDYPVLDTTLSHMATTLGIPMYTTKREAVHMHWGNRSDEIT